MSKGQRLTFLAIAAVIAIVAVVVLAGSGGDESSDSGEQAAATATPSARGEGEAAAGDERSEAGEPQEASPQATETPTPEPTPEPPPLLRAGRVTKLEVTEGKTVRFRVRSDTDEEIHVHAYDITREIPAGKTVNVAFKATITGIVEIEFHGSGETIGELTVEPS
jgi:hypothetical protein